MQALTHAKDANVELSGAKRLSRAAFGRSRALESTATGTMLLARRSRLFASGSRRARPLLRREERSRTTVAFSAQPSNSSRTFQSYAENSSVVRLRSSSLCSCRAHRLSEEKKRLRGALSAVTVAVLSLAQLLPNGGWERHFSSISISLTSASLVASMFPSNYSSMSRTEKPCQHSKHIPNIN
ncbi:unnamed protein product [Coccothraustes coccothraustes]